jgi:formate dehydrogenase iron-sulfur subunit
MTVRVFIPDDASALAVGADETAAAIAAEAAKRKLDVAIVRNGSRGLLWLEPFVEVETGGKRIAYGPVSESDVAALFDADFLKGGKHALRHGTVEEIPYFAKQTRLTFARCGIIDPLSLKEYEAHGGLKGLRKALGMAQADVVDAVMKSGLRGRGGAGFPAAIKWKTVLGLPGTEKYVCCNADEGDSGTFADRMLMEGDPGTLIEGMTIAGLATGATRGYIYIRSEYPHAIAKLRKAIAAWEAAGLLGDSVDGSGRAFHLHIRIGAGSYVCGEESAMLESLEGKRGEVRAKPPIPAIAGLFAKPTVVNNVLTLAAVPRILSEGPAAYEGFGVGKSRGTQPFQLAGNVKRGGLVEAPFGLTLRELIEDYGLGTLSGRPVRTAQVGGPLGAYVPASKFDLQLGYEELAGDGFMLGHGGVVVFDDTVDMARQARFAMDFCAIESCGKCTPCRIGAVRGRETLDKIIAGRDVEANLVVIEDLCELMTDGSLCAMGGLTPMPVMSAIRHFREDFEKVEKTPAG